MQPMIISILLESNFGQVPGGMFGGDENVDPVMMTLDKQLSFVVLLNK